MFCAKVSWAVAKGINSTLQNVANIVYVCYNSLVLSINDAKSDGSIHWYNKEIYTCLIKVKKTLDREDFTLPASGNLVTSTEIISAFKGIAKHSSLTCELLHALEALFMCTAVIWGLKLDGNHQSETLNILENAILSVAIPLDCSIEKNGKCKWSLKLDTTIFQTQVSSQPSTGQCSTTLSHFKIYAAAFFKYNQQQYNQGIRILHQFLKDIDPNTTSLILANAYNLLGCCYANIGSLHSAIVYIRKAIQCSDNNLACHLKNIIVLFAEHNKWDVVMQTVQILFESFECRRKDRSNDCILIYHSELNFEAVAFVNLSHWGFPTDINDLNKALHLAGSVSLRAECPEKAVEYYRKLLANKRQMTTIQTKSYWYIPSSQQITAAKELALHETSKTNFENEEFDNIKNELFRLSHKLNSVVSQAVTFCDVRALEEFIEVGAKMYHYLCYILCHTKRFIRAVSHISELSRIMPLIEWDPQYLVLPENADVSSNLWSKAASTVDFLNAVQAKFLLNKAIIMTNMDKKSEIFQMLQRVLKLAPRDIEIRWKLTLLLWRLGHKSEACKTWLKTRALDYKMTAQEIKTLVSERLKKESNDGRAHYQRDVAILKEVYKSRLQH